MNITALHLFSDEEGSCPFSTNAMFNGQSDPIITDGKITDVGLGGKLVYLGDLMDRYPNEIVLMLNMIHIHNTKPEQITLIAGNRDVNKMRLKDELKIKNTADSIANLKNKTELVQLANQLSTEIIAFEPYDRGRFDTFNQDTNAKALQDSLSDNPDTRLAGCVASLMAVNRPNSAIDVKIEEARRLHFFTDSTLNKSAEAIFVCLLYTILAGGYAEPEEADEHLKKLFNLYGSYLSKCKIMSLETVGDARVLVAHGGVPGIISNPIGYAKKPTEEVARDAITVINAINDDFAKHVDTYFREPSEQNIALLNYYVGLSGPIQAKTTHGPHGPDGLESQFTHALSPVVYRQLLDKANHVNMYVGGEGNINYDNPMVAVLNDDNGTKQLVKFVVFGHTPQGNAPTVWTDKETIFAAIDVSNSNDDSDPKTYSTFAVMTIRSASDMVVRGQYVDKNQQHVQYENSLEDYQNNPTQSLDGKAYNFRYKSKNGNPVFTFTNIPRFYENDFGAILEYETMKGKNEKENELHTTQANTIQANTIQNNSHQVSVPVQSAPHHRGPVSRVQNYQPALRGRNIPVQFEVVGHEIELTQNERRKQLHKQKLDALRQPLQLRQPSDALRQPGGGVVSTEKSWMMIAQGLVVTVACAIVGTFYN
jgi:hypothetical protein